MGVQINLHRVSAFNATHLRAFLYGGSMKPGRPDILLYSADILARALSDLDSEEAARCLALLPAGAQIAIVTLLTPECRARLTRDCEEWVAVVPILRKAARASRQSPLPQVRDLSPQCHNARASCDHGMM